MSCEISKRSPLSNATSLILNTVGDETKQKVYSGEWTEFSAGFRSIVEGRC